MSDPILDKLHTILTTYREVGPMMTYELRELLAEVAIEYAMPDDPPYRGNIEQRIRQRFGLTTKKT